MTRRLRYVLFTLAVPVAALVGAIVWMPQLFTSSDTSLVYDTTDVSRGSIRRLVSTSGPVRALITVQVGSQLSGQIVELKADFNTEVKPGDVMAVLDDKTFVARVAQAKADLAAAEAQVLNQEAALQRAEAVQRQAERAIARQQQLATRGVTAQAAVDTATRDSEVALAEIAVAKAQLATARATLAQRAAQLEQAQIDLDRTRVRSPIDGTVISRTIDIGQTVAASLQAPELFKIAQDLRRIRIEAQVNEADVGAVQEGNSVEFTVDAYPERKFQGRVTQMRLAATELQNVVTYTVIIEAANEDRRLFPGMTANAQIETDRRDDVLRVPNEVLRFKPRDRQATAQTGPAGGQQGNGERGQRLLQQLREELKLTDAQAEAVNAGMKAYFAKVRAERQAQQGQGGGAPAGGPFAPPQQPQQADGAGRARMVAEVERILGPTLTEEQRPLLDRWKKGREATRTGTVWVLAGHDIESRSVRLGIADDQVTEIVGGQLKAGDKVVTRAREAKKK